MSDRDDILASIRNHKRSSGAPVVAPPVPARGQVEGADRQALFVKMATAAAATVELVDDPELIP
ncbi:MAG TPA: hypothetical protein VN229_25300, partial [Terriglobales bacterium]|nr:hypothetical protein [Terriglobales bacterium]